VHKNVDGWEEQRDTDAEAGHIHDELLVFIQLAHVVKLIDCLHFGEYTFHFDAFLMLILS